jgi:hypothetical protein
VDTDDIAVVDWLLDQSGKAYESELQFTAKLRDRAGFILGFLVTPIGGAIISLITTFKGDLSDKYNLVFFTAPLVVASLALLFFLWKILIFLKEKNLYSAPHTPQQLLTYYNQGSNKKESFFHTKQIMMNSLRSAVEKNIPINEKRLNYLISCQRSAVIAVPFIVLCGFKYFHTSHTNVSPPIDVRLVNDLNQLKGNSNVQSIQLIGREACIRPNTQPASPPRPAATGTGNTIRPRSCRYK